MPKGQKSFKIPFYWGFKVVFGLGRLVGFEPTTSRTTIWRYYQLSYSRRTAYILTQASGVERGKATEFALDTI